MIYKYIAELLKMRWMTCGWPRRSEAEEAVIRCERVAGIAAVRDSNDAHFISSVHVLIRSARRDAVNRHVTLQKSSISEPPRELNA